MSQRNIVIVLAIVVIVVLLGWSRGWFGGSAPAPVAPATAPTTTAPATGTTTQ